MTHLEEGELDRIEQQEEQAHAENDHQGGEEHQEVLGVDHRGRAGDIGAAQGAAPVQLGLKHAHLKGIGFDLPAVRPVFEKYVRSHGLEDRVKFQPGDFFKDPLPRADVLIMGHILHDWDLEQKKLLIRKAYEALPEGGAFIIYEALIDDDRSRNALGLLMSLNMLIETPGGFDYTGDECAGWMRQAGFASTRALTQ